MAHQFDRECMCFECIQKARKEREQKPLVSRTFNDEPNEGFQDEWNQRQLEVYGSIACSCGSGWSPEECCG